MGVDKRTKNGDVIYDVAIIGGGASGLAAAITAARAGARCCIVEADVEAGLGILATGNGRCNISNARLAPRHFLHEDAARAMFGAHAERDIADFFERLGLMLAEEGEGRLYPVTRRAESVRDVLLNACSRLGVDILTCATVSHAAPCTSPSGYWDLTLSVPAAALSFKQRRDAKARVRNVRKALAVAERTERTLHARRVIIAVGGRSASTCEVFRLAHLNETPVLCPIACEIDSSTPGVTRHALALEHLDGLRVEGALSLMREGAVIASEVGEVLFRPYGISGIAALNLSRRIEPGDIIELDLFPSLDEDGLRELLCSRINNIGAHRGDVVWFDGLVARPLAHILCTMLDDDTVDFPARAVVLLHHLRFRVHGTTEHAQAHVHRGGIPLSSVNLETCGIVSFHDGTSPSGLFACGEALDMDADCGGYNLAWAWTSGMRAGLYASKGTSC